MTIGDILENIEHPFDNLLKKITENYKTLDCYRGNRFPETVEVVNTNKVAEFYPASVRKDNSVLYVDEKAYKDARPEDFEKVFIHELAHCVSGEDHDGVKFAEAVNEYNAKFGTDAFVNPMEEKAIRWTLKTFPTYTAYARVFRRADSLLRKYPAYRRVIIANANNAIDNNREYFEVSDLDYKYRIINNVE